MGAGLSVLAYLLRMVTLVTGGAVLLTIFASAQVGNPWYLGQKKTDLGQTRFFAARYADNLIASGDETPDYAALYIISCLEHDSEHWQQTLELEDKLSAKGNVMITVQLDTQPPRKVLWTVDSSRRRLQRTNRADVAALQQASRLTLTWSWGWSWLWLSDEAIVNMSEVSSTLYTLSKQCGIDEP